MLRTFLTRTRQWSGVVALFAALGTSGAYAARELVGSDDIARSAVRSKHIKAGDVKSAEIAASAVNSLKVTDGSLLAHDFAAGQLPRGEQGPAGPAGPAGPYGPVGPVGPGDTPQQVRDKVSDVDGESSGIEADLVDDQNAADLDEGALVWGEPRDVVGPTTVSVTCPPGFWIARAIEHQSAFTYSPFDGVAWSDRTYTESAYTATVTPVSIFGGSGSTLWLAWVNAVCVSE